MMAIFRISFRCCSIMQTCARPRRGVSTSNNTKGRGAPAHDRVGCHTSDTNSIALFERLDKCAYTQGEFPRISIESHLCPANILKSLSLDRSSSTVRGAPL